MLQVPGSSQATSFSSSSIYPPNIKWATGVKLRLKCGGEIELPSATTKGGGGGSRDSCPGARNELKLLCSVIYCHDIKVKFSRGPVSISCPGACPSSQRPWMYLIILRLMLMLNKIDCGTQLHFIPPGFPSPVVLRHHVVKCKWLPIGSMACSQCRLPRSVNTGSFNELGGKAYVTSIL